MSAQMTEGEESRESFTFDEFRKCGFLWLINTVVFHPRGYAIAFVYDDRTGEVVGWELIGNGTERFAFAEGGWPDGQSPDDAFLAAETTFSQAFVRGLGKQIAAMIQEEEKTDDHSS